MDSTHILGYIGALIVGLVLGLIGGGGSILTVPLLVYLLGYNPVVATAYSLFVVGTSSMVGTFQKYKEGLVEIKTGLAFSFPSFIAVYLSRRYLVPAIPNTILNLGNYQLTKEMFIMIIFAIIMLLASVSMIKKKKEEGLILKSQPYFKTFFQGIIIGVITGIIGAGGGFLYVPALVIWANIPMKKAVGTSLIIITINSLIGFLGDVQNFEIDWAFLLVFTLISVVGIIIGVYLSKFISGNKLKKSFGFFILIMAVYIIYKELKANKT
ncbi:sulfite exporter TauE/SafE family protein [Sabulilitoribacter multivorans]|uniref:Probable membrane transporter protein n=1 Tax=Flaviramulus multivorans TaxID=1304750 RepID=A0ABS9ILJ3_9FLAO|nr:sulfite exporter TauE/SafE family protein [Flaviramulus multivorans]MCF7561457.1 sulfite exporter TauE/SafE family protein [Flaviramulus multivorans]